MTEENIMTEENRPTIMIATPMYGGMCTGSYVQGLLSTMQRMQQVGVKVYWSQMTNESLITRGRNELTRIFLESECDYLMFIDADIGFTGQDVATLLAADRDIACGIYPKKDINWEAIGQAATKGREDLEDYAGDYVFNMVSDKVEADEDGMIEIRHGGTGFMLIKRKVFDFLKPMVATYRRSSERLADGEYRSPLTHEFFFTSIDKSNALLSEDYAFCELWREFGGKLYANPFLKLTHTGTYVYGGDIMKGRGRL